MPQQKPGPNSDEEPIPQPDLSWLVPMRSKIQHLTLEIYNFDLALDDKEQAKLWSVQGYLIGIAFSLWRAVFLSPPERKPSDMYKHGRDILHIILETNAVGFAQDKGTRQWMAGYYNNNAILRLLDLFGDPDAISILKVRPDNAREAVLGWYQSDQQVGFTNLSPKEQWDKAFEALERTFRLLQDACPEVMARRLPRTANRREA